MSRDASVTLPFGDDDYVFRLAWGDLAKLQEACDAGPYVILDRLASGRWMMGDIREVIRYGLIGGGTEPTKALKLVREYVESRPPVENLGIARQVLAAGVVGAPEEEIEKKAEAPGRKKGSTSSRTAKSGSEPCTASARSSASHRKM